MIKYRKTLTLILLLITLGNLYRVLFKDKYFLTVSPKKFLSASKLVLTLSQEDEERSPNSVNNIKQTPHNHFNSLIVSNVLSRGNGIIFMETTDRMQPSSLVLCAIESAARVYEDRPVVFFMKGLNDTKSEDTAKKNFPVLSSFKNIYFLPLIMEDILAETPLSSWYRKADHSQERFWTNTKSNGCRLALIWKYGGIYMDTDIISIRPIPNHNFLSSAFSGQCTNSVFGFPARHNFPWICMEDFVKKYNGNLWGNQGPQLFSRVLKTICHLPKYKDVEDLTCGNMSLLHPKRFSPISYPAWRRYYTVWDKLPAFNYSYSLHLWNYMNKERRVMVPGSNTLVENLYQQHCPSTYAAIQRNASTFI